LEGEMPTYDVTMEATVHVVVEADDEDEAAIEARRLFKWTDVKIEGVVDVDEIS
jgi:hypothetical protein